MSAPAQKLQDWLTTRDGVAHTSAARLTGYTGAQIAAAVVSGQVFRVRRSWLVTPDCHAARVRAASVGGRVTCVTLAKLHDLWVPRGSGAHTHVAVPGTASRLDRTGLTLHWSTGPAPVARTTTDDHVINMLFHIARCLPLEDAAMVWESAINHKLVDSDLLRRVLWRSGPASELAHLCTAFSQSGLETRFVWIVRGIRVAIRQQVWLDGHPVDALIGERLVVQIDGFAHHSSPADRRRDIAADARLVLRGYTVLRFDYRQILFEPDAVLATVLAAVAQGLHLSR